jgi:putative ABC transport system permease protein
MILKTDIASFNDGIPVDMYNVSLKPGVATGAYVTALSTALRPLGLQAIPNSSSASSTIIVLDSMAAILTLMLVAVAGLGVLNSVVLDTRERVHDLGVCKAIGMSPRQTVIMVLASVIGIGAVGGLIGVPTGVALHDYILPLMGDAAGTRLTAHMREVYQALELLMLGAGGVVIAVLGAMVPAGWAARARTGTALRTE